jgi:protein-tyrosine phosphatase
MPAIESASVANLRDLGGIPLPGGGRVRAGRVFRAASLYKLDPAEPVIAELGIRTVVDLRTTEERTSRPDLLPPGARLVIADALADQEAGSGRQALRDKPSAAHLVELLADPAGASRTLGDGEAKRVMQEVYRSFVTDASAHRAFQTVLELAADPDAGPVLIHCTAGKDRTGWSATLILALLGADPETVEAEYLAVRDAVRATFSKLITRFETGGGDPAVAEALIGVDREYLAAALGEARAKYGSLEGYVHDALGLSGETVARLRAHLVEPGRD